MNTTLREPLQFAEFARNALILAFLAAISIAPLYTSGRATLGTADAPAAEPEPALPASSVRARPAATASPESVVLTEYLSQRYRLDPDATRQLVNAACDAGQQEGLDPLLVLAVIAIESRFNPIAESIIGAKGLMQVVPAMHADKIDALGGAQAMLDPMINIHVGARILSEYIVRQGSLEAGLQFYNGASSDATAAYARKVLAEQERLRQAVRERESGYRA